MRTWARVGTVAVCGMVMALVVAVVPAGADSPVMLVHEYEQNWEDYQIDNPCTVDELDPIAFEGTATLREILFGDDIDPVTGEGEYDRRITAVSYEIAGPDSWSGKGTDTGVELASGQEGVLVLTQFVVTNSDSGQKFRFVIRVNNDPNTGLPMNEGVFGSTCVIP